MGRIQLAVARVKGDFSPPVYNPSCAGEINISSLLALHVQHQIQLKALMVLYGELKTIYMPSKM